MVDFNNESTISTSAANVVKILILQRRADLIESIEGYKTKEGRGIQGDISPVLARLHSLFLELQGSLMRRLKKDKQYEAFRNQIYNAKTEKDVLEAMDFFSLHLDEMRLTRIDTKQTYESGSWESENKIHGL